VIHTNDKELLKLAAKAAGIEIEWYAPNVEVWDFSQVPDRNPLTDGGDALRLAVQLGLDIEVYKTSTHVYDDKSEKSFQEDHGDDPYAATCRAIVRAAAAIGEGM
jgi:hypothetical protein